MAKGRLFEYAVLYHPKPTKEQNERGETPKSDIVVDLTSILALDDKQVAIIASRALPDKYIECLEDVEIVVRPL